jgi:multidrug efflux pump subunit AcrA (membrane-fusion protein)
MVSPLDGIVAERRPRSARRLGEATRGFVPGADVALKVDSDCLSATRAGGEDVARARVDLSHEVFEGKVTIVVRAVDPATRMFVVEAEIPNRDERLKPGLSPASS